MRGRTILTADDAAKIRSLLTATRKAPRDEQKRLRDRLRKMGFFITDFSSSSSGFTDADFDRLITIGTIRVKQRP